MPPGRLLIPWVAALAATPLLTLWLIARHGVNVPVSDDWALVPLFIESDAGTLSLGDLLRQHHEHVPVFPRAADFLMAPLTSWDLRVEMYRNFGVVVATFGLVLVALRRTLDRTPFLVAAVIASLLVFSPVQSENWLWGWQLEWFLSNLAAIGAFYALAFTIDRWPRRALALAAGAGFVATFSLGQGLLVWPVGLAILVLRGRPWRAWTAAGVAAYALHFYDWHDPEPLGAKDRFLDLPGQTVEFVLLYLGGTLGNSDATRKLVAVAMLAAFAAAAAYVVRHRRDSLLLQRASVWLALGLYVLGAAVITAVSRVTEEVVVPSRYNAMGALFALATTVLVYLVARAPRVGPLVLTPRLRHAVVAAVAVPLLAAAVVNADAGADALRRRAAGLEAFAACSASARRPDDPCPGAGRDAQTAILAEQTRWWRRIQYLKRKGWGGY
ncbi:MAG TPA: hypothetical protein VGW10_03595 [Solirubrobacteraceae bacterium]|nr:hypothetical protein [Solirubrobacteraceae bacterium]